GGVSAEVLYGASVRDAEGAVRDDSAGGCRFGRSSRGRGAGVYRSADEREYGVSGEAWGRIALAGCDVQRSLRRGLSGLHARAAAGDAGSDCVSQECRARQEPGLWSRLFFIAA